MLLITFLIQELLILILIGIKTTIFILAEAQTGATLYAIGIDGDRDEVIRKYQYDFERGYLKSSKEKLLTLRGKTLGCHCKPAACHGDLLANYLNSLDDGK